MPPKKIVERGVWSEAEHDKFLDALKVHPKGPWRIIAAQVGTRSARQVQTHAQKYYEKVARRVRGLRKERKNVVRPEHRLDEDMLTRCQVADSAALPSPPLSRTQTSRSRLHAAAIDAATPLAVDAASNSNGELAFVPPSTKSSSNDNTAVSTDTSSFVSLLMSEHGAPLSDFESHASDSDDMDSLGDVDDYYLDFLLDALSARDGSDCRSSSSSNSDGSCSE